MIAVDAIVREAPTAASAYERARKMLRLARTGPRSQREDWIYQASLEREYARRIRAS